MDRQGTRFCASFPELRVQGVARQSCTGHAMRVKGSPTVYRAWIAVRRQPVLAVLRGRSHPAPGTGEAGTPASRGLPVRQLSSARRHGVSGSVRHNDYAPHSYDFFFLTRPTTSDDSEFRSLKDGVITLAFLQATRGFFMKGKMGLVLTSEFFDLSGATMSADFHSS